MGILVCTVAWRLVSLQIVDEERNGERAERDCIEFEVLPAQRGLIMDRNEEILTNNILYSELVADRYHLRDPKMVCWGWPIRWHPIRRSGRIWTVRSVRP